MAGKRRWHAAAFKAKVALEAAKQSKTVAELAKTYQVHPVQVSQWKKRLLDGAETLFRDGRREREEGEAAQAELYEKIGRLNMETVLSGRMYMSCRKAEQPVGGGLNLSLGDTGS